MKADTFCKQIVATAEDFSDKVAMTLLGKGDAEETTFSEMLAQIRSVAFHLMQEGIEFGDRVALIGENHPNWAVAYLGILYRGATVVPLDPTGTIETLTNFIEDSQSKLAFVSSTAAHKFQNICERLGRRIPAVSLHNEENPNGFFAFDDFSKTEVSDDFKKADPPAKENDLALLIYTSGTTGKPKAVPLTHGNIFFEISSIQEVMKLSPSEVILSLLPLFHAYSQIVNLWLATTIGARVVYLSELKPEEIGRGMREGKVTALTGVPRLWYLFHKKIFDAVAAKPFALRKLFGGMLSLNGFMRDYLNINAGKLFFKRVHNGFGGKLRLAVSAGSSFDAKVAKDFHKLGFTILQGYGLTETSGAATVTRFEDNKVGSVGTPLNGVEVKIDSPNEEGIGEVLIRGPIVMPGYYNNPEANKLAFTEDGWFLSGDLGYFDKDGHLYIVGRKKEIIILPSGKNVYPEDVEAHYAQSQLVGEICVLGIKDEAGDFAQAEKLCAVIVPDFEFLKLNKIANAREAIRFELDNLGRELPEYQRVRDYILRSEPLPRTPTRKLRRFELRKQIETEGIASKQSRALSNFEFSEQDKTLISSSAGQSLVKAIQQHSPDVTNIHPRMNLELDLGLDSLARAECLASLEQSTGMNFDSEKAAVALTVGEVIALAENGIAQTKASHTSAEAEACVGDKIVNGNFNWREILNQANGDATEIQQILKRKIFTPFIAYVLLRFVYLFSRLFLRMEVEGLENLRSLKKPFLICPNHQSYLDPVLVCSVYPKSILQNIFHVGASEYFRNFITSQIARLINIVPVDPDSNLLRAMRAGAVGLKAGKILNIYPEGERSFDGLLHPFKKGAAILATESDLPIVPVALDGVYKVWARKSKRIRFAKVKIKFGEPIHFQEKNYEEATAQLKETIQKMLDEMRKSDIKH
jgi:long-chain acyl-CoA synthetase